ncbi:hypothetical protein GGQ04_002612 [Salinibacter ruber]|nr:hypothetical protein [Salinibacter ruber]MCS3856321.1 hypothetical protein [Salinibacter ruber]MCS3863402.1 hypothetical protein [Salinibacter ruber]MCS4047464.1 hypothetical protein [Salinibacter ruber]MCS4175273.1 hypothetical protein [Salinibacter ruber]
MDTDVFSVLNVDRRKVPFSEVYACFFLSLRLFVLFDFVLAPKLMLAAVPADLGSFRFFAHRPVD